MRSVGAFISIHLAGENLISQAEFLQFRPGIIQGAQTQVMPDGPGRINQFLHSAAGLSK